MITFHDAFTLWLAQMAVGIIMGFTFIVLFAVFWVAVSYQRSFRIWLRSKWKQ